MVVARRSCWVVVVGLGTTSRLVVVVVAVGRLGMILFGRRVVVGAGRLVVVVAGGRLVMTLTGRRVVVVAVGRLGMILFGWRVVVVATR